MRIKNSSQILWLSAGALILFNGACAKKDVKVDPPPAAMAQPAPAPVTPPPPVDEQNDLQTVHFEYDSAALSGEAKTLLKKNAIWLKEKANRKVSVKAEGHCDERGSEEYNLRLGEKRAEAVKHFLTSHGVPAKRITVESFGKDRPLDLGHDESAWAKNRRCAFRIQSK